MIDHHLILIMCARLNLLIDLFDDCSNTQSIIVMVVLVNKRDHLKKLTSLARAAKLISTVFQGLRVAPLFASVELKVSKNCL